MAEEKGIWIITAEDTNSATKMKANKSRSFWDDDLQSASEEEAGFISVETLQQNLSAFLANIDETLEKVNTTDLKSGFKIEEIELSVGVNGQGKIGLSAIGVQAGGNAGIKLKLKRKI